MGAFFKTNPAGHPPVEVALPMLERPYTLPPSLRVASVSIETVTSFAGLKSIAVQDGATAPVAGVLVAAVSPRDLPAGIPSADVVTLFPNEGLTARRGAQLSHIVASFARRYAAVLARGRVPYVLVPLQLSGEHSRDSAALQAFYTGVVAAALSPKGVLLCANSRPSDSWGGGQPLADGMALAASQGRLSYTARTVDGYDAHWHHPAAQLARFVKSFKLFDIRRRAEGGYAPTHYMWRDGDNRHRQSGHQFSAGHEVLLQSYPASTEQTSLSWVKAVQTAFRPGSNFFTDSVRGFNTLQRWLSRNASTLVNGNNAEVEPLPTRALPPSAPAGEVRIAQAG